VSFGVFCVFGGQPSHARNRLPLPLETIEVTAFGVTLSAVDICVPEEKRNCRQEPRKEFESFLLSNGERSTLPAGSDSIPGSERHV
jgi:hypothetical protein